MIEVGTTNRTHVRDYEHAVTDQTAALLHVHTSNYRVLGFVSTPTVAEMVELGRKHSLLVIDDLGSGLLDERLVRPSEPEIEDRPERGARAGARRRR